MEFYQYNCPKGAGHLHDSYKIYRVYMLSLGGATIGVPMCRKILKSEKMGAKFVHTTSTI